MSPADDIQVSHQLTCMSFNGGRKPEYLTGELTVLQGAHNLHTGSWFALQSIEQTLIFLVSEVICVISALPAPL